MLNITSHSLEDLPVVASTLDNQQVHVYWVLLDEHIAHLADYAQTLTADETERAGWLRFEQLRQRFILRRGILRHVLAAYVNASPAELRFSHNMYGKPQIKGHPLQFNLSHSDACALIAVTQAGAIGVDVEAATPIPDMLTVARYYFSDAERSALAALPEGQRTHGFYNAWTRKEAIVKAVGQGITFPLQNFSVSLTPDEPARLLHSDDARLQGISLAALPMPTPYVAACAVIDH